MVLTHWVHQQVQHLSTNTNKQDRMNVWAHGEKKLLVSVACCVLNVFANMNVNSVSEFRQLAANTSVNAAQ